jgi:hypothetical protein
VPSDRYEHKSEDLWQQYLNDEIDHDKYMQLLKQLKSDELQYYSGSYRTDAENGIWKYEKRRRKERQLEAEQEAEAERIKKLPLLEKYKETTQATIAQYRKDAWVAPFISILVTISAGFTGYFKYRERSFNLQQTADNIEQEYTAVNLTIGPYKGKSPQEALVLFAERVEALKVEQRKREQQLEQPPDVKQGLAET